MEGDQRVRDSEEEHKDSDEDFEEATTEEDAPDVHLRGQLGDGGEEHRDDLSEGAELGGAHLLKTIVRINVVPQTARKKIKTHVFRQPVVVATQAEDEVAGLPDVDAVPDVLEEEGEALPTGQCRHVALGQRQVSAGGKKVLIRKKNNNKSNISRRQLLTSPSATVLPARR